MKTKPSKRFSGTFLILAVCFMVLFSSGLGSALDFDNWVNYEDNDMKVRLVNTFNLGSEIGTVELKSHKSVDEILKVAPGENVVTMYYDFDFKEIYKDGLGEVEFINMSSGELIQKDYHFVIWETVLKERINYSTECTKVYSKINNSFSNECEKINHGIYTEEVEEWVNLDIKDIPKGKSRIGLATNVNSGDVIDGIWTITGKKIKKHAAWTSNLNVELISYYKLDETSGPVMDSHGSNDGTNSGATRGVVGLINNSFDFNGTDQYANTSLLLPVNDITISIWIKPDIRTGSPSPLGNSRIGTDNTDGIQWYFPGTTTLSLVRRGTLDLTYPDDNDWHMVTVIYNSTGVFGYIDGVYNGVCTTADCKANFNSGSPFTQGLVIGGFFSNGALSNDFDGKIDECGFWNRSLNASEIVQLYNNGTGLPYQGGEEPGDLVVTLNSPDDNFISNKTDITFNCSATASGNLTLENISLWTNITGTWQLNETIDIGFGNYTYNNFNFSVSSQTTNPQGITWNGTFFWVLGGTNVHKYTAAGAYALTSFSVSGTPRGITWNGTSFWVLDAASRDVYEYNSSGSYTGNSFSVSVQVSAPGGITWNGTSFWVVAHGNANVYEYNATGSYTGTSFYIGNQDGNPTGITWNGTSFWVLGDNSNIVYEYNATGSYTGTSFSVSSQDVSPTGITWNGTTLWVVGDAVDDAVYEYAFKKLDNITATFSKTISDTTIWNCEACADSTCSFATNNRTLFLDLDFPNITVESPNGTLGYNIIGRNETLNVTFTDVNLESCWYNYNNTNTTIAGCLTGVKESILFILVEDELNMTIYSNDSVGHISSVVTSWEYLLLEINQTYNYEVTETSVQEFSINLNTLPNTLSITSILNYNGTRYTADSTCVTGACNVSTSINIPLIETGEAENKSFVWEFTVFTSTQNFDINSSENVQLVTKIHLEECDVNYTVQALNFTAFDEQTLSAISSFDFDGDFLFWSGTGVTSRNFSISKTGISSLQLCIEPGVDQFFVNAIVEYDEAGTTNYTTRNYFFQNDTINNVSQDIKLGLLLADDSTSFILKVQDRDILPVAEALIFTQKFYPGIGEYRTVQVARTDTSGASVGFFETEISDYRFIIKQNGRTVLITEGGKVVGSEVPFTLTFTIGDDPGASWEEYEELEDLLQSTEFNKTSSIVTYTYQDTSTTFSSSRFIVEKINASGFSNIPICDETSNQSTASFTCNLTGLDTGQYMSRSIITRESVSTLVDQTSITLEDFSIIAGRLGLFLGWFIILISVFAFKFNEIAGIILINLAIIFVNLIGLIAFGYVFISAMVAVSIIILVVLER